MLSVVFQFYLGFGVGFALGYGVAGLGTVIDYPVGLDSLGVDMLLGSLFLVDSGNFLGFVDFLGVKVVVDWQCSRVLAVGHPRNLDSPVHSANLGDPSIRGCTCWSMDPTHLFSYTPCSSLLPLVFQSRLADGIRWYSAAHDKARTSLESLKSALAHRPSLLLVPPVAFSIPPPPCPSVLNFLRHMLVVAALVLVAFH